MVEASEPAHLENVAKEEEESAAISDDSAEAALPIEEFRSDIISMVQERLFCIITGETGSGKSTQIAQFLLDGIG